jgi:cysteine desulfurase
MNRLYLDHNASAPLRPEARAAMNAALEVAGNPSSVHSEGRAARAIIETAREQVARLVNAKPAEVVFTGSATESNNTVAAAGWDNVFIAGIEHASVALPVRESGAKVFEVPVGADGVAEVGAIADTVLRGSDLPGRTLVTLQIANSETGVLQPVADTAAFAREHGFFVHSDGVQAAGRIEVDFEALGVDALSLSSHKLGGPQGVGALVIRDGVSLTPLLKGGGQERRRRAGTENVAGIAGFGAAAEAARAELGNAGKVRALRDRLEAGVQEISPNAIVIGRDVARLPNTSNIAIEGLRAETLVIKFDLAGIALSAGSACSSGKVGASEVLRAMGIPAQLAQGAVRVSLEAATSEADIDRFLAAWAQIVGQSAIAA